MGGEGFSYACVLKWGDRTAGNPVDGSGTSPRHSQTYLHLLGRGLPYSNTSPHVSYQHPNTGGVHHKPQKRGDSGCPKKPKVWFGSKGPLRNLQGHPPVQRVQGFLGWFISSVQSSHGDDVARVAQKVTTAKAAQRTPLRVVSCSGCGGLRGVRVWQSTTSSDQRRGERCCQQR